MLYVIHIRVQCTISWYVASSAHSHFHYICLCAAAANRYVCNLNPSTSKDQLQRFFSTCGNIRCITIPLDPEVHQPLGHAYVEFSHAAEAEAAAKLTKQQLEGRQITVYPKKTNIRGYDVFQGHTGYSRRGRRGFGRGGFGNTFGRQGAAFPEWGQ